MHATTDVIEPLKHEVREERADGSVRTRTWVEALNGLKVGEPGPTGK
jgi:hypothetical protein